MKKFGLLLFVLGIMCFGAYFLVGPMFSDVKVMFNSNGGSVVQEQVLKNGEKAVEPEAPTKENATFVEWQLNGKKYDFNESVTSNILLTAIWNEITVHNVKVTIDSNEYTTEVRDGENLSIESLSIPSKEGYRIVLYNGEEVYNIDTPVTSDLELTGKYVEIVKYKVTFNSNGGSKVDTKEVVEGEKVDEATTTRDGYEFDGWYLENDKFDFTSPITKNITLKARWTEKGKVNVIFMVDGKVYKTIPVKEGTKVSKPSNPTKKGYKFVEWQLDGAKFDFNTKINSETTLTATFEETTTVTVKFDSNGGTSVSSQEIEVGAKAKKPSNPTKKNYKFVEWQLSGKTYDFNKEVNEDITLKAKWEEIVKHTVTFDSNGGGAVANQIVNDGEKAKAPAGITRTGYKLEGWVYEGSFFDFSTPITKNITLTARWKSDEVSSPDIIEEPIDTVENDKEA